MPLPTTAVLDTVAAQAQRKITRRLIPFLFLLYVTAFIDRVNVSFAGLDMTRELHFSNEVFGFGAGIFFFGYCLLEIPGAMLAQAWSARKWIAVIMIGWGMLAALTGLIHTALEFNCIRFLLGFAEGGFFPAVVVYLTHWFRQEDRAKAIAMFMAAIPVSNAVGAPLAGVLLHLHWLGLSGWRWLLILEGVPAFVCGIVTLFYLTDWPKDAAWLEPAEREWITRELDRESRTKKTERGHAGILDTLRQPVVLALALSYFLLNTSGYGLNIWLPKMVQKFPGLTTTQISLVSAIPPLCAIPLMLLIGWHSDRTGERKWHAALAAITAGIGLGISQSVGGNPVLVVAAFSLATIGVMCYYPPYWALPTRLLSDRSAAASFGFVNLIANFGGFAGPYMVGFLTDRTGSYLAGVWLLVSTAVLSGLILMMLRER
ncbi:MAG: MFS transporter [Acidobacteriota bacterium]|nr:MFS transporter [Acidobacteriota bacterium]